jgi:hypothetical protein
MEALIRVDQGLASERRVLEQGEHGQAGVMTLLSIMIQGMKLGGEGESEKASRLRNNKGRRSSSCTPDHLGFAIRPSDHQTRSQQQGREPADTQKQQQTTNSTNKHTYEHHLAA